MRKQHDEALIRIGLIEEQTELNTKGIRDLIVLSHTATVNITRLEALVERFVRRSFDNGNK